MPSNDFCNDAARLPGFSSKIFLRTPSPSRPVSCSGVMAIRGLSSNPSWYLKTASSTVFVNSSAVDEKINCFVCSEISLNRFQYSSLSVLPSRTFSSSLNNLDISAALSERVWSIRTILPMRLLLSTG